MGITTIAKRIFVISSDLIDRVYIFMLKYNEKRKFKDKRRKAIYKKVHLTKEQKKQIDDLYKANYGKKIPYT